MGDDRFLIGRQSRADELEERLIEFAVRVVNLSANLPRTPAGKTYSWTDHAVGYVTRAELW
jgi:hypothetical protein